MQGSCYGWRGHNRAGHRVLHKELFKDSSAPISGMRIGLYIRISYEPRTPGEEGFIARTFVSTGLSRLATLGV